MIDAPRDDLFRALSGVELRAAGDGQGAPALPTLAGHYAVWNRWTEIDSWYEGTFLERIAPTAADKTHAEQRSTIKVLFDHGYDPEIGNKPLGPIEALDSDETGAAYAVPLIDTPYNRGFIVPAVEAGLLGASFRFRVIRDEWNDDPGTAEHNPKGLPERTILEYRLYEFGPVTFPAYPDGTTVGLRSLTDHYVERMLGLGEHLDDTSPVLARAVERLPQLRQLAAAAPGQAPPERGARGTASQEHEGAEEPVPFTLSTALARRRLQAIEAALSRPERS